MIRRCKVSGISGVWILALTGAFLAACGSQDDNARGSAEKAISAKLKDPSSARFSDVFLVEAKAPVPETRHVAVCGTVDGKNSFGAYSGGSRFVVLKSFGLGQFKTEGTLFAEIENLSSASSANAFAQVYWSKYCEKK